MIKTTLNFFGEEVTIDTPKDIGALRGKISEKYLLSSSDAAEIILYYVKDGKKVYIINGNDFSQYKDSKISTIFLDVNQNSRLYKDNASQLDKEKEKNEKELAILNYKYQHLSKKKTNIEKTFEIQLKDINMKIMEMNKIKCEIIKKKDIELTKLIKDKEHFEKKIYYYQKKLSVPITVPVPKEEELPKETTLKNSPKQVKLTFTPLKISETERRKHVEKCKLASIAKCIALSMKKMRTIPNEETKEENEENDLILSTKLKSIAKARAQALILGKKNAIEEVKRNKAIAYSKFKAVAKAKSFSKQVGKKAEEDKRQKDIDNVKSRAVAKAKAAALKVGEKAEEDKRQKAIANVKYKSIEKAKALALKVGQMAEKANNTKEEEKSPINTVSVFQKVNEVLGNAVEKVKDYAKDLITNKKEVEIKKEEIKDEKERLKIELEAKKLKEKEKKEQIDKIVKITRDTINEINHLTKMVMTQSNLLIEQINNPDKKFNLSSDEVLLRAPRKEVKIKEPIHFGFMCDGCKKNPIRGRRYKCKECKDFDFCESCYQENKEKHGHEFMTIEKPKNTRRMGHKNTKYCQRGIVHRDVRCEHCGLDPLVGWRYMCTICEDYNLCENCEEGHAVKHGHPFIKVTYPSLLNSFNNSYFKMNYYEPKNEK